MKGFGADEGRPTWTTLIYKMTLSLFDIRGSMVWRPDMKTRRQFCQLTAKNHWFSQKMEYYIVTVYGHNKDKVNLVQYRKEQLFLDGFFL